MFQNGIAFFPMAVELLLIDLSLVSDLQMVGTGWQWDFFDCSDLCEMGCVSCCKSVSGLLCTIVMEVLKETSSEVIEELLNSFLKQ